MPDGLYDRDALQWSEEQADLLRRLAGGERVNDAVDWPNVIEEVEAMGRSELRACETLLERALTHLLKLHAWPQSRARSHWMVETLGFLSGARRAFTPSMRQPLSLPDLFDGAVRVLLVSEDDSGPPRPVADTLPFTLDDLLQPHPDIEALLTKLC